MKTETDIMNQIRLALSAAGHTNFRGNVGKVRMADGRWFSTGLPEGFSDLFGFRKSDAKMFFIEVKTPTGRLRKDQERFLDAMNDIFLDVLFQHTRYGEDYTSIHFSRHKILHGENKRYGRKDYVIRCFMILDFLSELMFIE